MTISDFRENSDKSTARISIVLPTFNERGNIETVLQQLRRLESYDQLVILDVDDGSTDGTAELIRQLC